MDLPESLTTPQKEKIEQVAERFGCLDNEDITVYTEPFDLPAQWCLVIIGEEKGRPFSFGVSPEGDAHS